MSERLIEDWRSVPDSDGYEASALGQIRRNGRLLSPYLGRHGYLVVSMRYNWDHRRKTRRVHALVMEAFIGPRPDGLYIAHGDGDKTNNCLANLRYCTPKENKADDELNGARATGSRHGRAKLNESTAAQAKAMLLAGSTQRAVASKFGLSQPTVKAIAQGKTWRHVEPA